MNKTSSSARILWDFVQLSSPRTRADCIIILGSYDTSVADRGAALFKAGLAPLVVVAGGRGRLTSKRWKRSEAWHLSRIMVSRGVPQKAILLEENSTNTAENITFTRRLLNAKNISVKKAIFVMTPCLERRAFLVFQKKWPSLKVYPPPEKAEYASYVNRVVPEDEVINLLVGELSRLIVYPQKGYLNRVAIPSKTLNAFHYLVERGYTKYLVTD